MNEHYSSLKGDAAATYLETKKAEVTALMDGRLIGKYEMWLSVQRSSRSEDLDEIRRRRKQEVRKGNQLSQSRIPTLRYRLLEF